MRLSDADRRLLTVVFFGAGTLLAVLAFGPAECACKPPHAPTDAEAGAASGGGVCTLLEGLTGGGALVTICVTADELAQLIDFILRGRAGRVPAAEACTPLPGSDVCATRRELGDAIEYVVRERRARLSLEGGAR